MLLVLVAVAACTGAGDPGRPSSPTRPSPGGSRAATPEPTGATASTPAPTGTATGVAATGASYVVRDPVGDLSDPEGDPPPGGGAGADLTRVDLERGADGSLEITVEVAGAVPQRADSLLWAVELDGGQRYTAAAQLTGGELSTGIYDHRLGAQHPLGMATVRGATVTLRVPSEELAGLGSSFGWWASTQLDGAYEDRTERVEVPE